LCWYVGASIYIDVSIWGGWGGEQSEVNFLGRLSHPNLVKLLGFGREDDKLFLVYEFMPRGSLHNHLCGSKSSYIVEYFTRTSTKLPFFCVVCIFPDVILLCRRFKCSATFMGQKAESNDWSSQGTKFSSLGEDNYIQRFQVLKYTT